MLVGGRNRCRSTECAIVHDGDRIRQAKRTVTRLDLGGQQGRASLEKALPVRRASRSDERAKEICKTPHLAPTT